MKKRNNNKRAKRHSERKSEPITNDHNVPQHSSLYNVWSRFKSLILWFGSAGFLVAMATVIYDYIDTDIRLEFVKALTNGYEFTISNNGPTDQLVESFRVLPPTKQKIIYKITEDIYGTFGKDGAAIPGGPNVYVPAAEFKELDNQVISSKSKIQFRLPPLANRTWLQPEAALLDVKYSCVSKNVLLKKIEQLARAVGLKEQQNKASFLVINNYWTPVKTDSLKDAIGQACKENSELSGLEICRKEQL